MENTTSVADTSLDKEISLTFTKQDWIVIWNVLTRAQYSLPDAFLVKPITDKIHPVVAQLSDKDEKIVSGIKK